MEIKTKPYMIHPFEFSLILLKKTFLEVWWFHVLFFSLLFFHFSLSPLSKPLLYGVLIIYSLMIFPTLYTIVLLFFNKRKDAIEVEFTDQHVKVSTQSGTKIEMELTNLKKIQRYPKHILIYPLRGSCIPVPLNAFFSNKDIDELEGHFFKLKIPNK